MDEERLGQFIAETKLRAQRLAESLPPPPWYRRVWCGGGSADLWDFLVVLLILRLLFG
jgi:hypothetical protein